MNMLGWHLFFRRKSSAGPSSFARVLPRLRAMRENLDWPCSTTPATREQRRERVRQARRRIVYLPEPCEIAAESTATRARWRWLTYAAPFGVLAAAVVWVSLTADWNTQYVSHGFNYQLSGAPPFLSERLALIMAMQSLAEVVPDPMSWTPKPNQDRKARPAPDGTRDSYMDRFTPAGPNSGIIVFVSERHPYEEWDVSVQLQGAQVWCSVSKPISTWAKPR